MTCDFVEHHKWREVYAVARTEGGLLRETIKHECELCDAVKMTRTEITPPSPKGETTAMQVGTMKKLILPALQLSILLSLCMQAEAKSYRDPKIRAEFQRLNPCPNKEWQIRPGTQGGRRGACPGWERDHATPICAGGKDEVSNYQWLTVEQHKLKTKIDVLRCRMMKKETK